MIEMDGRTAVTYTGGYSSYLVQKAEQEEQAIRDDRKRSALVRQELDWMRGGCKARTTKQKARMMRAETLVYAPKKEKAKELEIGFGAVPIRLSYTVSGSSIYRIIAISISPRLDSPGLFDPPPPLSPRFKLSMVL